MFLATSGHSNFKLDRTRVIKICAGRYADLGLWPVSVGVKRRTERVCNVAMRDGPDIMMLERRGAGRSFGSDDFGGES